MKTENIMIIGCGAMTENFYLPAMLKQRSRIGKIILIDRNEGRLNYLAHKFGVSILASDYSKVNDRVDGIIIATPPASHFSIIMSLVSRSIPILCEKPLVENSTEVEEIIAASKRYKTPVAINNTRRFFPSYKKVKELLQTGVIGKICRVEYHEGAEYAWPTVSGFYFNSGKKGVLMDRGPHVLDLLCWWLVEKPSVVSFQDDSFGGPEAVCEIDFKVGSIIGNVRLSWLTKLANRFRIEGDMGSIEGSIYEWDRIVLNANGKPKIVKTPSKIRSFDNFAYIVLSDFLNCIQEGSAPAVQPPDVCNSLVFIDECYAMRKKFQMTWL
ncbi:MAG: Gfo/Idh/MocA family oxidoreductase [Bacteroidota bacterium]